MSILSLMKHNREPLEIYLMTIDYQETKPFAPRTAEFLDALVSGRKWPKKPEKWPKRPEKGQKIAEVGGVAVGELPEWLKKGQNPRSFVKLIDATETFVQNLPKKNMGSYFTPCSMLRLYADRVPELAKLERILYLDYDVVCRKDISEFYHTDLDGIEAAGVLDIYGRYFYHYHGLFKTDYMNSGVMLFNLAECRKTGMFERAVELCAERWMMLADQAALNKSIARRKLMPRKYNEQGERPRPETVLHHFSNNFKFWPYFHVQKVKPFEVEKIHQILKIHEYDDILAEYQRLEKML